MRTNVHAPTTRPHRLARACAAALFSLACGCRAAELLLVADDAATASTPDAAPDLADLDAGRFYDMGVTPPITCPDYHAGPDFGLCAATYVGGPSHDRAAAVAIAPSGEILLAGLLAELASVSDVRRLYTAGSGAILRLDAKGTHMLSLTRIGQIVNDLAIERETGAIAIATDFGVAVLDPQAERVEWMQLLDQGAERVDIGRGERVVALTGSGELAIFEPDGTLRGQHWMDARMLDVAVDGTRGAVYVVGEAQGSDCAATLPVLRALDLDAQRLWTAYDDPAAGGTCAASSGTRVTLGADGLLYYAGQSEGEDSVHLRDPSDTQSLAALVSYDTFTSADGASQSMGFVARFDPETGALMAGQVLVPRDGTRAGRLLVHGMVADADGRLYVAGEAGCCLSERDVLRVAGKAPGPYRAGDAFVAILAPDFGERLSWVTWTGDNAAATRAVAVDAVGEMAAVVINQPDSDGSLITHNASLDQPAGNGDVLLSTWPAVPVQR